MDEKQISELLECSVCLERLDQTCKVLPCQHTFCRRCLDEILLTKQELRCPECRALVTIRVADLPTNILVVRILEGLKTKGVRPPGSGGRHHGLLNMSCSPAKIHGMNPLLRHESPSGHLFRGSQPCAKALYNYESSEKDDLPFKKGELILLHRQIDENWFRGELLGRTGFFPANFVQVLVPLPQIPQCRALYDFELKDEGEKDCLSFKKDEVLTVIRRVDDNWLEGRKGDKIGIFPLTFVDLNDSAISLINTKSNLTILPSSSSGQSTSSILTITTGISTTASTNRNAVSTNSTTAVTSSATLPSSSGEGTSTASSSQVPLTSSSNASVVPANGSRDQLAATVMATSTSATTSVSTPEVLPQNKRHSYTSSNISSPATATSTVSSQQRHSAEVTLSTNGNLTIASSETTTTTVTSAPTTSTSPLPSSTSAAGNQTNTSTVSSKNMSSSPNTTTEATTESASASVSASGSVQSGSLTTPL